MQSLLRVWGGANVLLGALVLGDLIVPSQPVDEHAPLQLRGDTFDAIVALGYATH